VDFKFWLANLTLPHSWLCQLCVVLILLPKNANACMQ
jgi:hypothetical protein